MHYLGRDFSSLAGIRGIGESRIPESVALPDLRTSLTGEQALNHVHNGCIKGKASEKSLITKKQKQIGSDFCQNMTLDSPEFRDSYNTPTAPRLPF